jgi:aspartyl-tRNA(Asn)/glutamyl-tRNA(Gln) amidotransferase subunit B
MSALQNYPDYEVVIGIEVHVQLTTNSKIFCTCANEISETPNTNICQICVGHPGVLPVLNKQVIACAVAAGLATNCKIRTHSTFARKHYFYPDLPKGYQITQSEDPICYDGYITINREDGEKKNIRLIRIHMEEDAGKNIHSEYSNESFVDLNRAGTPLLEIVSQPDISSSYEAREYLKTLRTIVQYLGIGSGNMEEGAFRADTNISVRKKGATTLGTKCELKNINSFKFISDAIEYEIERQIDLVEQGQTIRQETRLWDTKQKKTVVMRSKEEAADYRYFEDPDLPLIHFDEAYIAAQKGRLPELPQAAAARLEKDYGLSTYEADILVGDKDLTRYFEAAYRCQPSKQIINWILRDVLGYLKESKTTITSCTITAEKLAHIIRLLETGKINNHAAKQIFEVVAQTGKNPEDIVREEGLEQVGSVDELEAIIKEILAANPQSVADYKAGKERLFGFFVGQAMQKTKGKGNPAIIQELLKKNLS